MMGFGSPWPDSEAKLSKGRAGFVFLALSAADSRLFGCAMLRGRMVLMGRGGGRSPTEICSGAGIADRRIVERLVNSLGGVPTTWSRGEAFIGLLTASR